VTPPHVRRRIHIKLILAKRNRYQFGQPRDSLVAGGSVACFDTSAQLLKLIWHGKRVSLNYVRRLSGAPPGRPTPKLNGLVALRKLDLPYVMSEGKTPGQILRIVRNRGPVILAGGYWATPDWRGYRYLGRTADGTSIDDRGRKVRVGFAEPLRRAGKTQWTFRGGHAYVVATVDDHGSVRVRDWTVLIRDHNHNSPSRPERPRWDELTFQQFSLLVRSIRSKNGGHTLTWTPTKKLMVKA